MDLFIRQRAKNVAKSHTKTSTPSTPKRDYKLNVVEAYENAQQKIQLMIQYEQVLRNDLEKINGNKQAKLRRIEQLKEEIKRDEIKEEQLKKKIDEIHLQKKIMLERMDHY